MNEKHPSYDILAAKQADLPSLKTQDLLCFATTKREARNPKKFEGGKPNNNYRKIKYSWKHEKKRGIHHLLFVSVCVACCIKNKCNRKMLTKTGYYFFFATFCLSSPFSVPCESPELIIVCYLGSMDVIRNSKSSSSFSIRRRRGKTRKRILNITSKH